MRVVMNRLSLLTRRFAVVALGLWLCGAGCALCCAPPVSDAQALATIPADDVTSEDAVSAPSHCPAHARATSRGKARGSGLASASARKHSPADSRVDICCARTSQTSDAARKQQPADGRADDHTLADFSWTDDGAGEVIRPNVRGRAPGGRATHVRCCVFLI